MKMLRRYGPLLVLAAVVAVAFASGVTDQLSLHGLRRNQATLAAFVAENRALALLIFIAVYAAATAVSLPGALFLTLAGGLLFGVWLGGTATVIGATLGAVIVFYIVRSSLGAALRERAEAQGGQLKKAIDGVKADAFAYILTLRLIPIAPFWLVNVAAALADAPLRAYALATVLGFIPATFIYSGVGAGIAGVVADGGEPDLGLIFRPQILIPLVALGLLSLGSVVYRRSRRGKAAAA
jgi:uncharacterized membrane protein YdjX (TVP38/TMEM64 family)